MDTKFGVILFDDPEAHDAGWSCVWQGEDTRPVRTSNTGELSSDTAWLTNLDYGSASISGLSGLRFRRGDFFQHDLSRIWAEVGLDDEKLRVDPSKVWGGRFNSDSSLRAAFSAWLFRQTVLAGNSIIPVSAPVLPTMPRGLASLILPSRLDKYFQKGVPPKEILKAINQADLAWQPVARKAFGEPPERFIRLRPNRVVQAIRLLNSPWPISGRWQVISQTALSKQSNLTDWLNDFVEEKPLSLLRVTVERTEDPLMERLINFGANVERKSEQNKWITSVDFKRIAPFCVIKVHQIIYTDVGVTGMEVLERAGGFGIDPDTVPMRAGAYSFGLFLEMLWRAVSSKPNDFKGEGHPGTAFIRAYDRAILFESVISLANEGYSINGYGSGNILIEADDKVDMGLLARHAINAGLFAPFTEKGAFSPQEAAKIVGDHTNDRLGEASRRLEMMMLLGDLDMVIKMDEALSLWSPPVSQS